jgi:hypothetical protein
MILAHLQTGRMSQEESSCFAQKAALLIRLMQPLRSGSSWRDKPAGLYLRGTC